MKLTQIGSAKKKNNFEINLGAVKTFYAAQISLDRERSL